LSAYNNFLSFFKMHNKERLNGLSESCFTAMIPDERTMAFNYLLNMLQKVGTEESIHSLFMADELRAFGAISDLLKSGTSRDEAQIAAAWNLYRSVPQDAPIKIFIKHFSNPIAELRGKAAYYVPSEAEDSGLQAWRSTLRPAPQLKQGRLPLSAGASYRRSRHTLSGSRR
jgi:hypothetical protein